MKNQDIKTLMFSEPSFKTPTDERICSSCIWLFQYPLDTAQLKSITMQVSRSGFKGARRFKLVEYSYGYGWICPAWACHPFISERGLSKPFYPSLSEWFAATYGPVDRYPAGLWLYIKLSCSMLVYCPICNQQDYEVRHIGGDARLPETTFKHCNNCNHQWDHK